MRQIAEALLEDKQWVDWTNLSGSKVQSISESDNRTTTSYARSRSFTSGNVIILEEQKRSLHTFKPSLFQRILRTETPVTDSDWQTFITEVKAGDLSVIWDQKGNPRFRSTRLEEIEAFTQPSQLQFEQQLAAALRAVSTS